MNAACEENCGKSRPHELAHGLQPGDRVMSRRHVPVLLPRARSFADRASSRRAGLLAVVLGATAVAAAASVARAEGARNGLFPLWEQTGLVHPAGGGQIGYRHAQVSLGQLQLGTQPFLDLYGSWNANAKLALPAPSGHALALSAGVYRIPTAAEARAVGDLHRAAFSNPYADVFLVPVSLAHSFAPSERVFLHTTLGTLHEHRRDGLGGSSFGLAEMVEWGIGAAWSVRGHAGVWGLGVEPQAHLGLSFGYRGQHLSFEGGYARQFSPSGESRGLWLVDGALRFR